MSIDPKKKLAGILLPVFAIRRKDDLGIGDTSAVKEAIDFCRRNKITVLQTLPINETGGDNSPYNAISAMALDPVYTDMSPSAVPGLLQSDYDKLKLSVDQSALGAEDVDYQIVKKLKLDLFRAAFKNFKSTKEFESFKKEDGWWLTPYAVFRALLDTRSGDTNWTRWPEELQHFESAKKHLEANGQAQEIEFWSYVQWVANEQWLAVRKYADKNGVRIMGDIPFGVSRYSADVWQNKKLFDLEMAGGAPPEPLFFNDLFTKNWGQNWGIPLYDWAEHKKENFAWWKNRIKRLTAHFHDFRIDHILGFFRIYAFPWIPERNHEFVELTKEQAQELTGGKLPGFLPRPDEPEENAELNHQEGKAILKVIAEAASKSGAFIVAEDLGLVVPDYVRETIHELGMAGFAIPIFEHIPDSQEFKPVSTLHPLSLATYATHDHQTIAQYYRDLVERWHGPNGHESWLEMRRLMGLINLDPDNPPVVYDEKVQYAFEKTLVESPCWLVVMMISDLLGSEDRFNQPGLSGKGCWSKRLQAPLCDLESETAFKDKISDFAKLVEKSGRFQLVGSK